MSRIIIAGCSYSTPEGDLPVCWPDLLQNQTQHSVVNLSKSGGSNDRIYRVIHETHEREPITPRDILIIQHTNQNRFEITTDVEERNGRNTEQREYGRHIGWKVNSWRTTQHEPLRNFARTWEERYTCNEYNMLYYRRRHREFMAYARSNQWTIYHMWAAQYSRYLRGSETYDNVIDVSTVTDDLASRLAPDDEGHLSVRGHETVADHVAKVLQSQL